MKYRGNHGYANPCCGVSCSKIQNPTSVCLKVNCSTRFFDIHILNWNDCESTKCGPIFTKLTFLNMTYMKSKNNKNCSFGEKFTQNFYQDMFFSEIFQSFFNMSSFH